MALTRANVETILVSRTSKYLSAVGMSTVVNGTNTDLSDPIGYAIRQLGFDVSDVTSVSDSDLSGISNDDYDQLFDIAELRTLQNIQGNFTLVDIKIGPRGEALSDLNAALDKIVARKEKRIKDIYGVGLPSMSVSMFNYDFAEHDVENVDESGW